MLHLQQQQQQDNSNSSIVTTPNNPCTKSSEVVTHPFSLPSLSNFLSTESMHPFHTHSPNTCQYLPIPHQQNFASLHPFNNHSIHPYIHDLKKDNHQSMSLQSIFQSPIIECPIKVRSLPNPEQLCSNVLLESSAQPPSSYALNHSPISISSNSINSTTEHHHHYEENEENEQPENDEYSSCSSGSSLIKRTGNATTPLRKDSITKRVRPNKMKKIHLKNKFSSSDRSARIKCNRLIPASSSSCCSSSSDKSTSHKEPLNSSLDQSKCKNISYFISYDDIKQQFYYPECEAAKRLGCSKSKLKRMKTKLNIERWPYRRIQSLLNMKTGNNSHSSTLIDSAVNFVVEHPNLITKYANQDILLTANRFQRIKLCNLL